VAFAPRITDNRAAVTTSPVLDELRARIEAHLTEATRAPVSVASLERLAGGACQDNYVLVARFDAGPLAGERKLVLRSDARTSLPGSLDRAREYDVIRAAVASGVRTPEARWLARDLVRPESHAYFLDWVGVKRSGGASSARRSSRGRARSSRPSARTSSRGFTR
jgi:hypothetical protein